MKLPIGIKTGTDRYGKVYLRARGPILGTLKITLPVEVERLSPEFWQRVEDVQHERVHPAVVKTPRIILEKNPPVYALVAREKGWYGVDDVANQRAVYLPQKGRLKGRPGHGATKSAEWAEQYADYLNEEAKREGFVPPPEIKFFNTGVFRTDSETGH